MSRFLDAFRARQGGDREDAFYPPCGADNPEYPENLCAGRRSEGRRGVFGVFGIAGTIRPAKSESSPEPAAPPEPEEVAARAAALLRFAEQAFAALAAREADPIEDAERAAVFGGGRG